MDISLNPGDQEILKKFLARGSFQSESDVISEALRWFEHRERKIEEIKQEVQKGIDSGPATPLDMKDIKQRGRERLEAHKNGE